MAHSEGKYLVVTDIENKICYINKQYVVAVREDTMWDCKLTSIWLINNDKCLDVKETIDSVVNELVRGNNELRTF